MSKRNVPVGGKIVAETEREIRTPRDSISVRVSHRVQRARTRHKRIKLRAAFHPLRSFLFAGFLCKRDERFINNLPSDQRGAPGHGGGTENGIN